MANQRKKAINPDSVAQPLKPYYSNAVRAASGGLLFISGQVSLDGDSKLVGEGDLRAQAEQVHANIKAILAAEGATMADIVKVTVYVTDMRAFNDIADIRERYFPANGPSSVICEVSALAWPEFMIEVEAVAVVGGKSPSLPLIPDRWRKPVLVTTTAVAVIAAVFVAWQNAPHKPVPLSAFAANLTTDTMSAPEIKALMGGVKITGITRRRNRSFVIDVKVDGSAEVALHAAGPKSGIRFRDKGEWWARNHSFCFQFTRFARGRVRCPIIVREDGKLMAVRGNGSVINWKLEK